MAQQQHASDVRRRTALASHQPTNGGGSSSTAGGGATLGTTLSDASSSSVEYLDRVEEELNLKLDHDIQGLVQGLKDLVALARIDPLTSHPAQSHLRSVQQEARTQHMIKNAHSLLSISHQLKLLHLFGDVQHPLENRRTTERDLTNQIDHDKRTIDSL